MALKALGRMSTGLAVAFLVAPLCYAQNNGEQNGGEKKRSSNRLLEEVVVTAQKREEKAQDIPLAIQAFSADKLDAFGIESAQQLEKITPGLTITNAVGFNVAYLRGVGTDAFLPGADPSVPFYLDGVALLGAQGSTDTLGRVLRVEVLKGPQGTLFGRNATGGAINIITPDPGVELELDVKLEKADYDEKNVLLYASVPLADTFAVSLSYFDTGRDNYYVNEVGPIIDVYSKGGRAKARWDISEDIALTFAASIQEGSNNGGLAFENTRVAPVFAGTIKQDPKADRRVRFDTMAGAQSEAELMSLILDWRTDFADIKVIVSDQEVAAPFVRADFDKSEDPIVNIESIVQESFQKTAELQILSNADSPLSQYMEWVAGLYYIESSGGFNPIAFDIAPNILDVLGVPASQQLGGVLNLVTTSLGQQGLSDGARVLAYGVLDSEAYSAYTQATVFIGTDIDLTIGLRHQEEKRNLLNAKAEFEGEDGNNTLIREDNPPELSSTQFSPKVALQWRPMGDDNQIYASWSRAFKSPTYNTVNLIDEPERVDEEQVDSYELGFKSQWFDGGLTLNGALFHIVQENLLTGFVALASGGVVNYDNAGNSEISGAELDFLWTPMPEWNPGLVLFGAATYLDSEYTKYEEGRGYDEETGLAFGNGGTFPLPARDFTGNDIVRTPELTYTFGFNQSIPLGEGALELGADIYYNDGFYFLPQNSDLYARESYSLINARVSYFYDPWGLQLTVFGENVTDEVYNEVVFVDDFGRNQVLNSPRIVGARLNWTY
ncbi:TonB-dependent receptor [Spongiibacter sp. KMU-166]|uniref:TonB-dependent receptor n=1 Tax=Spongiibacter thalassae TaxID=2721624 RepID=A0ABX1GA87_9GAMM|nr:TonB-dependent receptor [Spongiibacter thalassae]NKI16071.1 TonB-dependent receptor [Spongiibacter thalassae]